MSTPTRWKASSVTNWFSIFNIRKYFSNKWFNISIPRPSKCTCFDRCSSDDFFFPYKSGFANSIFYLFFKVFTNTRKSYFSSLNYLKISSNVIGVLFCSFVLTDIILNSTLLIITLSFVVGT